MVLIAKAIGKSIGIILRAIFMNPIGLIILASLLLISIGILLISLAVKKLVDFIVDDLGPIIKEKLKMIDPETLNRFVEKVTNFIDVFTSIVAGIFAPVIAIGKLIMAIINPVAKVVGKIAEVLAKVLMPVIEFIGKMLSLLLVPIMGIIKIVIVAIAKLIQTVILPIIETLVNIFSIVWSIVKPIWDILSNVIMGILDVFKAFFDVIGPIITKVVGVFIKGAVEAIKFGIDLVAKIINMIWDFLCHPIDFIMSIVKGIGNWLGGFADQEIGVWKFKFKPFGFLKGIKTEDNSDEPIKIDDGKAQEVIDELQDKLKTLQGDYSKAQDQIKQLQEKLKEASSMKISKTTIVNIQTSARLSALTLSKSVLPKLKHIEEKLFKSENQKNTEEKIIKPEEPKLDIAAESVRTQFEPINNINNKNKENMKNMSETLENAQEQNIRREKPDITNASLKMFLTKMFENVDMNFEKISEKLDNPQMMPFPTSVNLNNQALIGA